MERDRGYPFILGRYGGMSPLPLPPPPIRYYWWVINGF